jgi:hypothetical protein
MNMARRLAALADEDMDQRKMTASIGSAHKNIAHIAIMQRRVIEAYL